MTVPAIIIFVVFVCCCIFVIWKDHEEKKTEKAAKQRTRMDHFLKAQSESRERIHRLRRGSNDAA